MEEVVVSRCPHGEDPNECPEALGIVIDGIKWDEDGTEHPYREWHPVCMQGDLCPLERR